MLHGFGNIKEAVAVFSRGSRNKSKGGQVKVPCVENQEPLEVFPGYGELWDENIW